MPKIRTNSYLAKEQSALGYNNLIRPVKSSISGGMGLNAYNSLNRGNRIRNLAKIIDENKFLLDKL